MSHYLDVRTVLKVVAPSLCILIAAWLAGALDPRRRLDRFSGRFGAGWDAPACSA
jgi:hypothetical protein